MSDDYIVRTSQDYEMWNWAVIESDHRELLQDAVASRFFCDVGYYLDVPDWDEFSYDIGVNREGSTVRAQILRAAKDGFLCDVGGCEYRLTIPEDYDV